jgi:hypothetical protein
MTGGIMIFVIDTEEKWIESFERKRKFIDARHDIYGEYGRDEQSGRELST